MICLSGGCAVSNGNNANAGWVDRVATWVTAQSFNNVLLLLILVSMMAGGYYAIKEAIPSHLKTIQEGYDRLDTAHREDRKSLEQQHTEQTKTIVTGFEKSTDRNAELIKELITTKKAVQ